MKEQQTQPRHLLPVEQRPEGHSVAPPYLSLDETWCHIAYVSEKGIEHLRASEIRVGDQFEINNPGDPLHGQRFQCTGIKENARTSNDAEPIPRMVEFRVSQSEYPDLFNATAEDSPEKRAILDAGTWAESWVEDAQKCRRVSASDEMMDAVKGRAFADSEIIAAGLASAINIKGRRLGQSMLEDIPADAFDSAIIEPRGRHGELYPAKRRAPDAIIYEALRFPRDMVWELWPPPREIVEIEHAEEAVEAQATPEDQSQDAGEKGKQHRRPGRPTFHAEMQAAYQTLFDEREIDFKDFMTALFKPIRHKVREKKGKPTLTEGLGDKAIRRAIAPLFKADKAAHEAKEACDNA